ncbi:DUF6228 family protein [Goodfellowiella coeruleoviolacea]|uniref:DUF6228 family protein n=1 Tax=Goodfellowiella coeruleoviolacea TaxID=334858 RepID=UPI0020A2EF6B|nr:DUF6228 family protein [Goodfellowiella coeruleoviolacea]
MTGQSEERSAVRVGGRESGQIELLFHDLSCPFAELDDDPVRDFVLTASSEWLNIEVSVRTWHGDGLDTFLASLAADFRGWRKPDLAVAGR